MAMDGREGGADGRFGLWHRLIGGRSRLLLLLRVHRIAPWCDTVVAVDQELVERDHKYQSPSRPEPIDLPYDERERTRYPIGRSFSGCARTGRLSGRDLEGTSLDTLGEILADTNLKVLELHGRAIYRHVGIVWRKSSALQSSYVLLSRFFGEAVRTELNDLAKAL